MSEQKRIETRDYWTIVALEACGYVPEEISTIAGRDGVHQLLVYHFPEKAADDFDAWVRGETKEPFDTVRKIRNSQRQFKANLDRLNG